jgi:ATP-dependent RNA helicase RhlE
MPASGSAKKPRSIKACVKSPAKGPGLHLHSLFTRTAHITRVVLLTPLRPDAHDRASAKLDFSRKTTLNTFSDFRLAAPILKALGNAGYSIPTPIQAQAIPSVLAGRDLCGIAQTGTGKTAAFALPILHNLTKAGSRRAANAPRVLVLTPTRELASQIAQSFRTYGAALPLKTAVIFGGVSQRPQADALKRGVDVLVATPGRLLDLIDQRLVTLAMVEVLVVDEADQMLDLGFIVPLKRIVKLVPERRQTLFFSATMPKTIAELADSILTNPVQVAVAPVATTAERVEQKVMFVAGAEKQRLLERLLSDPELQRVLVFTRTKHGADKVVRNLVKARIQAQAIHGNKSQAQRERALAAFKSGSLRVLVATDIAARGIHIDDVSHVVNFDLPNVPESYVHRIGRTARAGAGGVAISFCNSEERAYLRDIEKLTRRNVPVAAVPAGFSAERANTAPRSEQPRHEHRRGSGHPKRHVARGNRKSAQPEGRRSRKGQRRQHYAGYDERTGLPGFLTRPQSRPASGPTPA